MNISRERRAADVRSALDLLTRSRMVHLVRHTAATGVPLGATASDKVFKGILLDIGLASQLCGLTLLSPEQLLVVNEGGLAEQFVGQELGRRHQRTSSRRARRSRSNGSRSPARRRTKNW